MEKNVLLNEKLSKLFIIFVVPSVISMVISGMQGMIDGIFLGNYVSANAMASVNIAQPFMQIIIGSSMVVSVGAVSYLGRTLGEKNILKSKDIFKTAVISLLVISLTITLIGSFFNKDIASILGANEILLEESKNYIKIIALFAPIMTIMFLFGFTDRMLGKPKLYLYATIASITSNVIMDFLFIKVLKLGVIGAAFATGTAYFVALLIVAYPIFSKKAIVNIFDGKFNYKYAKELMANGSSEGVTSIAAAITVFMFNKTLMNFAGETGVAAFTIINYLGQFTVLLMFGVSDGINSIISYNYGANKLERVKKTIILASIINFIIGTIVFLIVLIQGDNLITVFVKDNEFVKNIAVEGAKIYAVSFLINGFNLLQSGYYTAIGNAKASILISASRGFIFTITGIIVFSYIWGISGVWFAVPFAELMTVIICIIYRLKTKNVGLVKA